MLTIRLQRGGRKGHPQYRVIVQDSRFSPTSGRYSALIGNYNPHSKELNIDTAKATHYLSNGAQPSDRVAVLLSKSGVELPSWVKLRTPKTSIIRNTDKLRRNRPAEEKVAEKEAPADAEAPTEEVAVAEPVVEEVAEVVTEEVAEVVAETAETPVEA